MVSHGALGNLTSSQHIHRIPTGGMGVIQSLFFLLVAENSYYTYLIFLFRGLYALRSHVCVEHQPKQSCSLKSLNINKVLSQS